MKLSLPILAGIMSTPTFQALYEHGQCRLIDYLSSLKFTGPIADAIEQLCILKAGSFELTKIVYRGYRL